MSKTEEEQEVSNCQGHICIFVTELLFIAARRFKFESLKRWCSSVLSSKINKLSAIRLLIFAHQNSLDPLKENCVDFIVKNAEYFLDQDKFPLSLFFKITKRKKLMTDKNESSSKTREFLIYEQVKEQTK